MRISSSGEFIATGEGGDGVEGEGGRGELVSPRNIRWECADYLSKPLSYEPKSVMFPTLFMIRPKIRYPV